MPPVDRILTRSCGKAPSPARYKAEVAQPHSGCTNSSASGCARAWSVSSSPLIPACTWHSPAHTCRFLRPVIRRTWAPEELVRAEQHLAVGVDGGDHVDRVGRGAADVGERLDRGGGVDVGDDDGAGVFVLPGPQFVGGDRVGQRAAGPLVRDQHGLVRAEDLGRLGHEVHAAEHDGVLGRLGGDPGQRQRIPDMVGDILDRRQLVVVRQHRGVAQLGQPANLGGPLARHPRRRRSRWACW